MPRNTEFDKIYKVKNIIIRSVCKLLRDVDYKLLELNVREEAISHRLAFYIEKDFSMIRDMGLSVDCEYNKHGDINKKLKSIRVRYPNKKSDVVRPDIVVHKRGCDDNNLLVIELKKFKGNYKEYTREKVRAYISDIGYSFGLYLEIPTKISNFKKEGKVSLYIKNRSEPVDLKIAVGAKLLD